MKLFLKFDNGEWEELGEVQNDSDIRYWIDRRIEKCGYEAIDGWLASEQIDVTKFVKDYHKRCDKYAEEQQEQSDKREYGRLRKKFGEPTQAGE